MISFKTISLDFDYFPLLVVVALAWLIPSTLSVLRVKRVPSVIVEIFLGYFVLENVISRGNLIFLEQLFQSLE